MATKKQRKHRRNVEPRAIRLSEQFIYFHAFVIGFIVMAFEMIGSRYLNPYFGSSIYTWASIISTVLLALTVGYFTGGLMADRNPSLSFLGCLIVFASVWFGLAPKLSVPLFDTIFNTVKDIRYGSLIGSFFLLFLPLALLGVYSPFAIRLTLGATGESGTVSGRVYGISTLGSILGTLITTFYFIPLIGTMMITYVLCLCTLLSGLSFLIYDSFRLGRIVRAAILTVAAVIAVVAFTVLERSDMLVKKTSAVIADSVGSAAQHETTSAGFNDASSGSQSSKTVNNDALGAGDRGKVIPRALDELRTQPDGLLEQKQTEYNDIFVTKRNSLVSMSFRRYSRHYTESLINLDDLGALPVPYTRILSVVLAYVPRPRSLLMLGLGGGTTTRYLHGYLSDVQIDAVELDPGVIEMAKRYFQIREGENYRIIKDDARVYIARNAKSYDIIMMDTFRGGYIPFHLLTQQFFELVKERVADAGSFVINAHGDTKLFPSMVNTLKTVFRSVDLYSSGAMGNVIVVANDDMRRTEADLLSTARTLQNRHGFRYHLTEMVSLRFRLAVDPDTVLLTDDFAPVNLLKEIKRHNVKRW